MGNAQKADIWSCGVIMYAMLYGKYPFDATQRNFARQIVNANYTIPQVRFLVILASREATGCCLTGSMGGSGRAETCLPAFCGCCDHRRLAELSLFICCQSIALLDSAAGWPPA